uniref:Uncharacterized protein n=1 Tax=Salix viminalis TaxID=40686 RepID=A0A6N2LK05_SALVM
MEMDSLSRCGYFECSFGANEGTILYMDGTTSRSALAFSASSVILNYYSGVLVQKWRNIGSNVHLSGGKSYKFQSSFSNSVEHTIFEVKAGLPAHTAFIHCKDKILLSTSYRTSQSKYNAQSRMTRVFGTSRGLDGDMNEESFCSVSAGQKGCGLPGTALFLSFKGKSEISAPPSSETTDICI